MVPRFLYNPLFLIQQHLVSPYSISQGSNVRFLFGNWDDLRKADSVFAELFLCLYNCERSMMIYFLFFCPRFQKLYITGLTRFAGSLEKAHSIINHPLCLTVKCLPSTSFPYHRIVLQLSLNYCFICRYRHYFLFNNYFLVVICWFVKISAHIHCGLIYILFSFICYSGWRNWTSVSHCIGPTGNKKVIDY